VSALIERAPKLAHDRLTHYLEASDTLDANTEQRTLVSRLLASVAIPAGAAGGDPNWLSGEKLPKGCSIPRQPRLPAAYRPIDGSNKFHVRSNGWRTVEVR